MAGRKEIESWKTPRNVGATRDCVDWTDTRNGRLDKANQEFKGARNGGPTTDHEDSKHTRNGGFVRKLTPNTRKLWNEGFTRFCKQNDKELNLRWNSLTIK